MQMDRGIRTSIRPSAVLSSVAAVFFHSIFIGSANAAEPFPHGLYLGVQAGESTLYNVRYRENRGKFFSTLATREWTDRSSNSYSGTIGYRIIPYFAVEVGYWDFGEGTFNEQRDQNSFTFNGIDRERYIGVNTAAKGRAAGIVASYPWRNWRVSAKLSALKKEIENAGKGVRTAAPVPFPPGQSPVVSTVALSESYKNTTALYGVSLSYTFADHYVIEADWRTAKHLGDQAYFDGLNVKVVGLGVQYCF
jgi:hypothetical protein